MELSKVSKKGLTNIPVKIRRAVGIEEGDLLAWEIKNSGIITIKIIKNPYKFLKGRHSDPDLTYEEVEEEADSLLMKELSDASNRA